MNSPTNNTNIPQTPYFFVVTPFKLAVMSILTFGFYELWWAFKNWLYVINVKGKKVLPFIRAWFSLIFMHSLLCEIKDSGEKAGFQRQFSPFVIFIAWVFLAFSDQVIQAFATMYQSIGNLAMKNMLNSIGTWLSILGIFGFVPLLFVQKYINELNLSVNPQYVINGTFTKGNWAVIIIGSVLWILLLFCGSD